MPPIDHDEARRAQPGHPGPAHGSGRAGDGTARGESGRSSADRGIADRVRGFRPRSLKGAVGLGIAGAALLLFPFLDDPHRWWIPAGLGLGTLVLLTLLRLDHLLKGWTWHVAGLALLAALVTETSRNPWAWAFAPSIGLLIAGLLRLPRWKIAAVGALACVLAIVGYQFRAVEVRQEEAAAAVQAGETTRQTLGKSSPGLLLESLERSLIGVQASYSTQPVVDVEAFCIMVVDSAETQLLAATAAPDCPAAITQLHERVPAGAKPSDSRATTLSSEGGAASASQATTTLSRPGDTVTVDACSSVWGEVAPSLGRVVAERTDASRETWRVAGFAPCR